MFVEDVLLGISLYQVSRLLDASQPPINAHDRNADH